MICRGQRTICETRKKITLTSKGPEEEAELLKPIPRTFHIRIGARRSPLLHCPHTSPSAALLVLSRGAAKLGIIHVVTFKLIINIGVHTVGRPGNTALARIELNLTRAVCGLLHANCKGKGGSPHIIRKHTLISL